MWPHSEPSKWNVRLAKPRYAIRRSPWVLVSIRFWHCKSESPVGVQVAVVMPTEQEREERRALHDRLSAIAARLNAPESWPAASAVTFLARIPILLAVADPREWRETGASKAISLRQFGCGNPYLLCQWAMLCRVIGPIPA